MALKYRFNLKDIKLEDFKVYLLAMFKGILPKKKIKNFLDLEQFIQKKSAWVTQVTLYNYLKTRMGTKYVLHFDNDVFIDSINLAKWNIYVVALVDFTFYVFSYLIKEKNLKLDETEEVFLNIINLEKNNGLPEDIYQKAKENFFRRKEFFNSKSYYLNNPFKESSLALYNWAPIADELKQLDKKIVINSINLKWNLVTNEFKELTKNLNFN